jgi:hypothetical protein
VLYGCQHLTRRLPQRSPAYPRRAEEARAAPGPHTARACAHGPARRSGAEVCASAAGGSAGLKRDSLGGVEEGFARFSTDAAGRRASRDTRMRLLRHGPLQCRPGLYGCERRVNDAPRMNGPRAPKAHCGGPKQARRAGAAAHGLCRGGRWREGVDLMWALAWRRAGSGEQPGCHAEGQQRGGRSAPQARRLIDGPVPRALHLLALGLPFPAALACFPPFPLAAACCAATLPGASPSFPETVWACLRAYSSPWR